MFVEKQGKIQKSGQRIIYSHQSKLDWFVQGAQVRPHAQTAAKNFLNRGRNICTHADPANAHAACLLLHWPAIHHLPQEIGKIYACAGAYCRPGPKPWVDVEKLVAS